MAIDKKTIKQTELVENACDDHHWELKEMRRTYLHIEDLLGHINRRDFEGNVDEEHLEETVLDISYLWEECFELSDKLWGLNEALKGSLTNLKYGLKEL